MEAFHLYLARSKWVSKTSVLLDNRNGWSLFLGKFLGCSMLGFANSSLYHWHQLRVMFYEYHQRFQFQFSPVENITHDYFDYLAHRSCSHPSQTPCLSTNPVLFLLNTVLLKTVKIFWAEPFGFSLRNTYGTIPHLQSFTKKTVNLNHKIVSFKRTIPYVTATILGSI